MKFIKTNRASSLVTLEDSVTVPIRKVLMSPCRRIEIGVSRNRLSVTYFFCQMMACKS